MIVNLCLRPDGAIDVAMYTALHTTLSLDDALDLQEIDQYGRSWRSAVHANMKARQGDGV